MPYDDDFIRKNAKYLTTAQDAIDAHLREQKAIEALKNPTLHAQAEIEKAFGPNASQSLLVVQKEIETQRRLEALIEPSFLQSQVEAALAASSISDLLRPALMPEANNEYLATMHQATENSKAALRELVAAEVKRQLEGRDNDLDPVGSE